MITNFINTTISKHDLSITLKVLQEFKSNESVNEWEQIPFSAWAKFEQLEEFLLYLVQGIPLHQDTIKYIESNRSK